MFGRRKDASSQDDGPSDPSRRRVLGGVAVAAGAATLPASGMLAGASLGSAAAAALPLEAVVALEPLATLAPTIAAPGAGAAAGTGLFGSGVGVSRTIANYKNVSGAVSEVFGMNARGRFELDAMGIKPRDLFSPHFDEALRSSLGPDAGEGHLRMLEQTRAALRSMGQETAVDWHSVQDHALRTVAEGENRLHSLLKTASPSEQNDIWEAIDPDKSHRRELARLKAEKETQKAVEPDEVNGEPKRPERIHQGDMNPSARAEWSVIMLSERDERPARFRLISPYGVIEEQDAKRFVYDLAMNKKTGISTACEVSSTGTIVHVTDGSAITTLSAIATNNIGQTPEERYGLPAAELVR